MWLLNLEWLAHAHTYVAHAQRRLLSRDFHVRNNFTTSMSKATKRKHVTREVIEEEVKPSGDQIIVKVIGRDIVNMMNDISFRYLVVVGTICTKLNHVMGQNS